MAHDSCVIHLWRPPPRSSPASLEGGARRAGRGGGGGGGGGGSWAKREGAWALYFTNVYPAGSQACSCGLQLSAGMSYQLDRL